VRGPAGVRSAQEIDSQKIRLKYCLRGQSANGTCKPTAAKANWRNRQTAPSLDRYHQIQQALAAKGHLRAD
jgi:hypothetical protein